MNIFLYKKKKYDIYSFKYISKFKIHKNTHVRYKLFTREENKAAFSGIYNQECVLHEILKYASNDDYQSFLGIALLYAMQYDNVRIIKYICKNRIQNIQDNTFDSIFDIDINAYKINDFRYLKIYKKYQNYKNILIKTENLPIIKSIHNKNYLEISNLYYVAKTVPKNICQRYLYYFDYKLIKTRANMCPNHEFCYPYDLYESFLYKKI